MMVRRVITLAVGLLALAGIASWGEPAQAAKKRAAAVKHPIRIAYVPPKDPDHQIIYERMKQRRVLEQFREGLASLRLPRPLWLKVEGCDGESNAWYLNGTVTVCYEYIEEVYENAPKQTTDTGLTPEGAVVGPVFEVFAHEIGHALFDLLKVPIFGREEDAADQFAALLLLQMGRKQAEETIRGVAHMYAREASTQSPGFKDFADVHGLPAQRFVNLLCLTYGANPKELNELIQKGWLPEARAKGCIKEYQQVSYAFRKLVGPYMNVAKANRVLRRVQLR